MIEGFRLEAHGKEDLLIVSNENSLSMRFLLKEELRFLSKSENLQAELIEVHRIKSALHRMSHDLQTWLDNLKDV